MEPLLAKGNSTQTKRDTMGKKIAILTFGSRGDVQPLIALGVQLKTEGYEVLIIVSVNNVKFVESFGLQAASCFPDIEAFIRDNKRIREAMESGRFMTYMGSQEKWAREHFPQAVMDQWTAVQSFRPDLLITGPDLLPCAQAFSQILQVPIVYAGLQLFAPTKQNKSMFNEPFLHYIGWIASFFALFHTWRKAVNPLLKSHLKDELGDKPLFGESFVPFMEEWMKPIFPSIVGCSSSFTPKPTDLPPVYDSMSEYTGLWVIKKENQLATGDTIFGGESLVELEQFLKKGEAPVYMGWGSMVAKSPQHMTCLAVRALKLAGLRGIILGGFAQLEQSHLLGQPDERELQDYVKENVLFVKTAPHEWLFPQCSAVVHHGGAGTLAAGFRAGVPAVITPCFADQFDNAEILNKSGAGIGLKQFQKVRFQALCKAIQRVVSEKEFKTKAVALSEKLQNEDGPGRAVDIIDKYFEEEIDTGRWLKKHKEVLEKRKSKHTHALTYLARIFFRSNPWG
jgi:sterol 3beta-glucosyltransferase